VFHPSSGPILTWAASMLLWAVAYAAEAIAQDGDAAAAVERDRLWNEAQALLEQEKLPEAIAAGEKVLQFDRSTRANDDPVLAETLDWLGVRYLDVSNFAEAKHCHMEAVEVLTQRFGKQHWRVANAQWQWRHTQLFAGLAPEERKALDRCNELNEAMFAALQQSDFARAIALGEEMLELAEDVLPPVHPNLAILRFNLARVYQDARQFTAARETFERALSMFELVYPVNDYPAGHPGMASCLLSLGLLQEGLADYSAARGYFERSLAMFERVYPVAEYPEGHRELAVALWQLGYVLLQLDDYAAAQIYAERALLAYERLYPASKFPKGHRSIADSLSLLGNLYANQANYLTARGYYDRALAMQQQLYPLSEYPDGHEDVAAALNNLAVLLKNQGAYAAARKTYQQALAMKERLYPLAQFPLGNQSLATSLNNLGILLELEGDYVAARQYQERHLAMVKPLYPVDNFPQGHPLLQTAYNSLAHVLQSQGEFETAQPLFEESLRMAERLFSAERYPSGHPRIAVALGNLGLLLKNLGDLDGAQDTLEKSLQMWERLHPKSQYPAGTPDLAHSLNNLGHLADSKHDFEAARQYHERALAMREQLYPREQYPAGHPEIAVSINGVGLALKRLGHYDAARVYYERGLTMKEGLYPAVSYPDGHVELAKALINLGALCMAQGDVATAIDYLARADRMQRANVHTLFAGSSEHTMHRFLAVQQPTLDWLLQGALEPDAAPTVVASCFRAALDQKTSIVDTLFRLRQFERTAQADPAIERQSEDLFALRQELADLALRPTTAASEERRKEVAEKANALQAQLNNSLSAAHAAVYCEVDIPALSAELPADAALIELTRYAPYSFAAQGDEPRWQSPRYVAFVLRGGGDSAVRLVDLGPMETIDELVTQVREAVTKVPKELALIGEDDLEAEYRDAAQTLYRAVVSPLLGSLEGTSQWLVVPDGELSRISWEALVDEQNRYLVESRSISYLSSGIEIMREAFPAATGTVLVADPDYALEDQANEPPDRLLDRLVTRAVDAFAGETSLDVRGLSWSRLPATRDEAEQIVALLRGQETYQPVIQLLGADALEGSLKRVRAPRLLHLATHGFYLPDQKRRVEDEETTLDPLAVPSTRSTLSQLASLESPLLRAGLVLAGANRQLENADLPITSEDGWVTAEEVGLMDFSGTQLVVLSACETGLGDIRTGEGVSGLRRAFIYAGAQTLVTSLYKVPDEATMKLMTEFYTRLAEGEDKQPALRAAKLSVIEDRRRENAAAHPFFWASFVLVGNPK